MLILANLESIHENISSIDDIDFLSQASFIDRSRVVLLGYLRITEKEEKRLDWVSKQLYGRFGFMEQIMEYNGILNADNVLEGDVIALPDLGSLLDSMDIQNFQDKFIEDNITAFNLRGNLDVNGQSKLPNRKISTNKKVNVDTKNGILVF